MKRIISSNKNRPFGLALSMLCVAITGIQFHRANAINYPILTAGVLILLCSLFWPSILLPLRRLMEWIGHYMGIVNTYLLLSIIYVLLFVPIGVIMKIAGRDHLNRKWDKNAPTYWIENTTSLKSSMRNQF
jgi:hypothetical protein